MFNVLKYSDFDGMFNGYPVSVQDTQIPLGLIDYIDRVIDSFCVYPVDNPEDTFVKIINFMMQFGIEFHDMDIEDDDGNITLLIDNQDNDIYFEFSYDELENGQYMCSARLMIDENFLADAEN